MEELDKAYMEYEEFKKSIKYENRFFIQKKLTDIFDDIISECEYAIKKDTKLYRARIHDDVDHSKGVKNPYKDDDIGMPKRDKVMLNGRINPKGINYFYLADSKKTSIAEVRPNILDYITIGKFKTVEDLKVIKLNSKYCIVDTNRERKSACSSQFIMFFIVYLQNDFCKPIKDKEKDIEYLPTQLFSEYCKSKGYDGIIYPSSVMDQNKKEHSNYTFFDTKKIIWIKSELIKVKGINYSSYNIN